MPALPQEAEQARSQLLSVSNIQSVCVESTLTVHYLSSSGTETVPLPTRGDTEVGKSRTEDHSL